MENIFKIIDAHTHLCDNQLFNDREQIIKEAKEENVIYIVNNADCFESFHLIEELHQEEPIFSKSAYGIHPEFANNGKDYLIKSLEYIEQHKDDIVAIGEIGLDYHYSKEEKVKEEQKEYFIEQIRLSKRLSLPIVIHARDAIDDVYKIIKEEKPIRYYLHCYSSSYEEFKLFEKLDIPFKIGIGGVSTYKNAEKIKEIIKKVDISYLLTETDAPYLSPVPFRGKLNKPSYLPYIISNIALLKEMDLKTTSDILFENGVSYYGIE